MNGIQLTMPRRTGRNGTIAGQGREHAERAAGADASDAPDTRDVPDPGDTPHAGDTAETPGVPDTFGAPGGHDAPAGRCELPIAAQLEAILFVAERPLTVSELAKLLHISPDAVEDAVDALGLGSRERGVTLQRHGDALQLVTDPRAAPIVQRFLGLEMSSRLSAAAMETLAIIAYRQPVTRAQIEALRGVNPDGVIANLVARGLIQEVGRLNAVGRPILYGTTFEFLRAFGLRSLDDLPPAGAPQVAGESQETEQGGVIAPADLVETTPAGPPA
jgi:segregation and condensation protein B